MSRVYSYLLLILAFTLGASQVYANRVIIRGHVKYANGTPALHHMVTISNDSLAAPNGCRIIHFKFTDSSGFYIDTLECSTPIVKVRISTENCNGTMLVQDPQVPPSNVLEVNFTLCNPPAPPACAANFTFNKAPSPQSVVVNFSSATSQGQAISWKWNFGNGTLSNLANPVNAYFQNGQYNVCLTTTTANGCVSTECKTITITEIVPPPAHCKSRFTFVPQPPASTGFGIKFNSNISEAQPGDSIRERIWKFGDGTSATTIDPLHIYTAAGSYNVCLIIRTVLGCSDTTCLMVNIPPPAQPTCHARFMYGPLPNSTNTGFSIKFNSNISEAQQGDTIRERIWSFGDGSTLNRNVDPTHVYAHDGLYNVCLTIKTVKGCTSQQCLQVVVAKNASQCAPQFTYERIAPKKVRFNSAMSFIPANDTIVERIWQFGDGTTLGGNVVGPVKEYLNLGIYTVCLKIKTARGCTNTICNLVRVQDSTVTPINNEPIRILSLYPTPATVQLTTVVWSLHNNLTAEISIYDVYGVKKWSVNKTLLQGNNMTVIPTAFLTPGPYYFRVTSMYGTRSRLFYKL